MNLGTSFSGLLPVRLGDQLESGPVCAKLPGRRLALGLYVLAGPEADQKKQSMVYTGKG